jgi:hypothetical protein
MGLHKYMVVWVLARPRPVLTEIEPLKDTYDECMSRLHEVITTSVTSVTENDSATDHHWITIPP